MIAAIYGTGRMAIDFLRRIEQDKEDIDIKFFVETYPIHNEFRSKKVISAQSLNYDEIDRLFIATGWSNYKEIINNLERISRNWDNDKNKIVYYRQFYSPEFYCAKRVMPYVSIKTKDNIDFITSSDDNIIANEMMYTKETFSKKMIDAFFELSEKYYGICNYVGEKYFLDLGANIGTTSIYVKNVLRPELRIVAIEACKDNFDLLRVNCILNHTEDIATELYGLSDHNGVVALQYEDGNPGGTCIVEDRFGEGNVKMIRLDDYIKISGIEMKDVQYIWMDVEGFEPKVIKGGLKLLNSHRIAMLHEFTPSCYEKMGTLEWYCENIGKIYKHFIDMDDYVRLGKEVVYSINEINDFIMNMKKRKIFQTDIFLF